MFKTFDYKSFSLLLTIFFVSLPRVLLYSTISLFSVASFVFSLSEAGLAAAGAGVSDDPDDATGAEATGDGGAASASGLVATGAVAPGASGSGA